MKLQAPYFGNRFAAVAKKKATTSRKAKAASEMEALEPRILLSGLTGGAKKSVSFFDADGDKVQVTLQGQGSFNIDLGGARNNADIANITINPDKAGVAGSLGVVVTPVGSFTKPVQTKPIFNPNVGLSTNLVGNLEIGKGNLDQKLQTQYYDLTPGYTNIGSITAAAGATQVGSIGLNAAVVPVIDLGNAAAGNINFSTGMVAKVDMFMAANAEKFGKSEQELSGVTNWNPGLANIQVWDISAGSIAGINISGIDPANYNGVAKAWGSGAGSAAKFDGNNFRGDIVATQGGIGRITGTNSYFDGTITLTGDKSSLGNVVLGYGFKEGSVITAGGDLSFNAANYSGLISVAGHMNLGISTGGDFTGTIVAGKGISGLGSSTTDTILISGGDMKGQLVTPGDISGIILNGNSTVDQADLAGVLDAKNIGNIWFGSNSKLGAATILASEDLAGITTRGQGLNLGAATTIVVGDTVGLLDVAGGVLEGSLVAKNVENILVRGGEMKASIFATNSIGNVTITDGQLTGTLIAEGAGGIGDIKVIALADDTTVVNAISGATIYSGAGIKSITASTADAAASAIGNGTNINALGTVGPITATAYGAGGFGINVLTFIAPSIDGITAYAPFGVGISGTNTLISTTGNIGNITATGLNGGILGTTTINSAASVAKISGIALGGNANPATEHGIAGLTINAQTGIDTITGKAFNGDGIKDGAYRTLDGNIANISGTSTSIGGTGNGISGLKIVALKGNVGNVTGVASGFDAGNGLSSVTVDALTGIGTIKGTAIGGNGINAGNYTVTGPAGNITAVIGETNKGVGIAGDAKFSAVGGEIQAISATPTGAGGRAVDTAEFTASKFGNLDFKVTNLDGGFAVNKLTVTAINGDIGNVSVTNDSLRTGAYGLGDSKITAEKGNIGTIIVSTDGKTGSYGIGNNTQFKASGNIGAINVNTTGNASNGIDNSSFAADTDNSGAGDITSVTVKVEGVGSIGANNGSSFAGQNIGAIDIQATNIAAGDAINKVTFDAAGNIASVFATTAGTGSNAIDLSTGGKFEAGGNITGEFKATGTSSTGGSVFVGAGLGTKVVDVTGNMGNLTITSASTGAANGLDNVKINVDGTLGAVAITTVGTGAGMFNSSIDPTTIASVNITSSNGTGANEVAIDGTSEIIATNSIGAVTITGNVAGTIKTDSATDVATTIGATKITGDFSGRLEAGTTISAIEITGEASGQILSGQEKSGNVTSIKAGTVNGLIVTAGKSATEIGSIGTITITGDRLGNQAITVNAFSDEKATPAEGKIGAIEAKGIATNGDTLTITVGAKSINLGAVSVEVAGATDKANLTIAGGAALTTIGSITVDGNLNLANAFTSIKSASTVAANTVVGGFTMGAGAGSSIGLITINDGAAAANNVTFNFATMNGKTNATADATLAVDFLTGAGPDITTLAAKAPGGATVAGVTAILI